MADDTYYITTHEAALAVVATAMKKSRLRLDTLMITSLLGGVLFSAGGMAHVLVQAGFQGMYQNNPAVVHLLQGAVYPIGLFYVVILGTDLFNSNVLFFTVGALRGAVSILDLIISWIVSFMFNLAGNLFVVYLMCHVSKTTTDANWIAASKQLVDTKLSFSFGENLLKGIPCNFLVSIAIYLQLMAKPLHVKFMMMFSPVFIFVSMGFNHVVADMYIIPIGLFNGADCSVGKYIWKSMIPSAIGNIIGGAAFGILIPYYLHLVVVEMDKKKLNLPEYEERDEQPEQGMDSRVVRVPSFVSTSSSPTLEDSNVDDEDSNDRADEKVNDSDQALPVVYDPIMPVSSHRSFASARSLGASSLSRVRTASSRIRPVRSLTRNSAERIRSPKGAFPVYGMGAPYPKERKLADANEYSDKETDTEIKTNMKDFDNETHSAGEYIANHYDPETDKISENLRRIISRKGSKKETDVEARPDNFGPGKLRAVVTSPAIDHSPQIRTKSHIFKSNFRLGSSDSNNNYYNISRRASQAGVTNRAVRMSDDIAGIHPQSINIDHYKSVDAANAAHEAAFRAAQRPSGPTRMHTSGSMQSARSTESGKKSVQDKKNPVVQASANTDNIDDARNEMESIDSLSSS